MGKIRHPRHSEGAVNAGEERLLKFLEVNLPDDYYIIPNAEFASNNGRGVVQYLEYDCLVVAPHGIYNLENKDWGGRLEGDDYAWFLNDTERANPLKTVRYKTSVLASKLAAHKPAWKAAWIAGAVTLSNPRQNKAGFDPHSDCYNATFLLDDTLIQFIKTASAIRKTPDAIRPIYEDIVNYLTGESTRRTPEEKKQVMGLHIVEILQKQADFTEYLCEPLHFPDQRYKVREYILDMAGKRLEELNQHTLQVQNAELAQQQLPLSPYIIKAECRISEDGSRFYEKNEYMDQNTLHAELRRRTFTQQEAIQIILDIAQALEIAHEKGVYHRDINPYNIYLIGGTAALANFGRSWFVKHHDLNFTIDALDAANSNPYQPAELFNSDVFAATDIYSLGVLFYELIVGTTPVTNYIDLARMDGELPADKLPSVINNGLPVWMDEVCRMTINEDEEKRCNDIRELRKFIRSQIAAPQTQDRQQPRPANKTKLKELSVGDQVTNDLVLYQELGEGGFARVFRARHLLQNKDYALKIFCEDVTEQNVLAEYQALVLLEHPHIVEFVYCGTSNGSMFYTLMELLDGENMYTYTRGDLRLPLNSVYKLATQILSALVEMQSHNPPIYHRDIKPSNIVWDKGARFVLIDFNIATKLSNDKDLAGTLSYLAPDLIENGKKMNWDKSADTFALGVTLYELLTHSLPWLGSNTPVLDQAPPDISQTNQQISRTFADWVMKAIGTRREQRFATAEEMLAALNTIPENQLYEAPPVTVIDNDGNETNTVDYINSLYSQSIYGNAGTRAGWKQSSRDDMTYTQTKLDKILLQDILKGKYRLVIITGNAGDGKTAFIRRIEDVAGNAQKLSNRNGANFTIQGIPFQSNYDGSQDEDERANNEVLADFFHPFENQTTYTGTTEGRIIAINEGRLVDFLKTSGMHKYLADTIDDYFYREGHTQLPEGLIIINLNLRSVTARDEEGKSLLRSQVQKLTRRELWGKCETCPHAARCFIKYNVDTLADSAAGEEVINRLEWLLRTIVYKRELHITMRDLRSFIAYMLTRDYSCSDVEDLLQKMEMDNYPIEYYWQLYYFNVSAVPIQMSGMHKNLDSNDRLVKLIRETDIAQVAIPAMDRDLYFKQKEARNYLVFAERTASLIDQFNRQNKLIPTYQQDEREKLFLRLRHNTFVRHQYYEGKPDFTKRLPYQSLAEFYKKLTGETSKIDDIKQDLAYAISCSEGCSDPSLSANYLVLSSSHVNDPLSKSYRRFHLSGFELFVKQKTALMDYIEYEQDSLVFRSLEDPHIQLTVTLDLYEMLYYIRMGFSPSINDLRGKFIELQVFKNLLQSKIYNEVLVTRNNKTFSLITLDPVSKNIRIEPLNKETI